MIHSSAYNKNNFSHTSYMNMNIKSKFPVFTHHPELIFLDSGASVQKPRFVLDAVRKFSEKNYANIHRGGYKLSLNASEEFENSRKNIANFLGTAPKNLIFTKNGTEASNMIAHIISEKFLRKGDEILISISEHHANILPWRRAAEKIGAEIIWVFPEHKNTVITVKDFENQISEKTKVIAFAHVANVTGQIFPVHKIANLAKKHDIITVLDACQSVPHFPVDFTALEIDFAFFTGHKLGAGGTGGAFISQKFLEKINSHNSEISPFLLGGGIVQDVTQTGYTLLNFPENFEAGTPNIEAVIGLSAAVDFLKGLQNDDFDYKTHGQEIVKYALVQFQKFLQNWEIIGEKNPENSHNRSGNISFYHPKIHHIDVAAFLSEKNIAVRTGFHCANPLHHWVKTSGSVRASFWVYSQKSDIDALVQELQVIEEILG